MVAQTKKRDRLQSENHHDDKEDYDDDEEMEFEDDTSTISTAVVAKVEEPVKARLSNQTQFSPELLSQYYSRLFPFTLLTKWLSYNPSINNVNKGNNGSKLLSHREFSFTIEPFPGDEIYIRYQSFKSQKEFENAVTKRQPRKIDIGAIFSHPPKDHHAIQNSTSGRKFQPNQRELVFDIDLTDYDGVRKCGCSGAKICNICWKMMNMAVKVMDAGLREDFGFQHICWFYSGRRGVHCWVCDESARTLSDSGRSAVANYFEVNLGTDKNQNVELYNPLHPCLRRAYTILEPMFIEDVLTPSPHGHNLLGDPALDICEGEEGDENKENPSPSWGHHLLSTLPPCASAVSESLSQKWKKDGDSTSPAEKWEELKRYLNILVGKSSGSSSTPNKKSKQTKNMSAVDKSKIELWPIKQVFKYSYPRLDINVSKMQNHLLKSPFCVHPKTGRVCVPIDVKKVNEFDPFDVPTLPQLMHELDSFEKQQCDDAEENNSGSDGKSVRRKKKVSFEWEKTSLKDSFMYFQKDFLDPMLQELRRGEKVEAEKMAAARGDF